MQRFDALFLEDCSELRVGAIALQEVLSVFLTKRFHESVAVLFADFARLVAMTLVESWLFHNHLPSNPGGATSAAPSSDADDAGYKTFSIFLLMRKVRNECHSCHSTPTEKGTVERTLSVEATIGCSVSR